MILQKFQLGEYVCPISDAQDGVVLPLEVIGAKLYERSVIYTLEVNGDLRDFNENELATVEECVEMAKDFHKSRLEFYNTRVFSNGSWKEEKK